jgi:hypothetical protein
MQTPRTERASVGVWNQLRAERIGKTAPGLGVWNAQFLLKQKTYSVLVDDEEVNSAYYQIARGNPLHCKKSSINAGRRISSKCKFWDKELRLRFGLNEASRWNPTRIATLPEN